MLARKQVLEEVSHYIGLSLSKAVGYAIWALLEPAIGRYHLLEETVSVLEPGSSLLESLGYSPIQWEKEEPPAEELAEVRGWISEALGEGWWERAGQKHKELRSILELPDYLQKALQEAGHES